MPTTTFGQLVLAELRPDPLTYDKRTALYAMKRRWHLAYPIADALGFDLTSAGIPATWTVLHEDRVTPVKMVAVTRSSALLKDTQSILTVEYEGHACMALYASTTTAGIPKEFNGIVASNFEHGTQSSKIILSYDVDPVTGKRLPIGPENEGTNRYIPEIRWSIVQNVAEADYIGMSQLIGWLIGKVNEANWVDPIYGWTYREGDWLYLGARSTQNRDGTYTLQHQLHLDISAQELSTTTAGVEPPYIGHRYLWYFLSETKETLPSGVKKIRKTPTGPQQKSRIYQTASGVLFANLFATSGYIP